MDSVGAGDPLGVGALGAKLSLGGALEIGAPGSGKVSAIGYHDLLFGSDSEDNWYVIR